jgi:hypothetical protein
MIRMSAEKFTNARVHEGWTPDLDAAVAAMRTTRVRLNAAVLWWCCRHRTPEDRATILGAYVKAQAMSGKQPSPAARPTVVAPGAVPGQEPGRARQRKAAAAG